MSTPDTMSGVQAAAGCVRRRNEQGAGSNEELSHGLETPTAFRGRNETKIDGFDESNPYGQGLGMGFGERKDKIVIFSFNDDRYTV